MAYVPIDPDVTRRNFLIRAGGFDPEMEVEDTDLFLRLGRTATFHYIDEPIFYSRYTPGSFGKKPWLWGRSIVKALSKHGDLLGDRLPLLLSRASAKWPATASNMARPGMRCAGRPSRWLCARTEAERSKPRANSATGSRGQQRAARPMPCLGVSGCCD